MSEAFSIFSARVRRSAWPEGEAENLVDIHKNHLKDALIDLQIKLSKLQENHTSITEQCATYYNCGATVFASPDNRALIQKIYTVLASDFCSKVYYEAVSKSELDCLTTEADVGQIESGSCVRCYQGAYEDLYYGDQYPDPYYKPKCRSYEGKVALHKNHLWLYPSILPTESVVVEWDGIKRFWDNADLVEYDRLTEKAVELYLKWQKADEDCDTQATVLARQTYELHRGDLIHQEEKEKRLPRSVSCFSQYSGCC